MLPTKKTVSSLRPALNSSVCTCIFGTQKELKDKNQISTPSAKGQGNVHDYGLYRSTVHTENLGVRHKKVLLISRFPRFTLVSNIWKKA